MKRTAKRVTMADVARAAGVSPAVAGRALGGYGYVSDDKRKRVAAAAARLGYRPDMVARSMVTGRTGTLGIIGADIGNPFFAGAVRGIADVARQHGFDTLLTNSDEDVAIERDALRVLLAKRVDGIIVSPADVGQSDHLREAAAQGMPLVMLDRRVADIEADAVVIDNIEASRCAVAHLIAQGHRRIALITELATRDDRQLLDALGGELTPDTARLNTSGARLCGYLAAHHDAGIKIDPELVRPTTAYSSASARARTEQLLALAAPPTALFTGDSVMTLGAFEAVQRHNIRIPDELAFLAFDDMEWMALVRPSLSALRQPVHAMGAAAARLLLGRLERPERPCEQQVFPVELRVRDSTRRPVTS